MVAVRFVLLAGLLSGCAPTVLPVTQGRIVSAAQFDATVAGKTASNDLATVTIHRDGRVTGVSDGQAFAGTWEWRDGYWCRTITAPVTVAEDCQVWELRDGLLIITRDKGTGGQLRFALPNA
jgi:hypothetical protein